MSRGYFEDISEIRKNGGKVYVMHNLVFSVLFWLFTADEVG
jgi:hypothetical protein